MKTAALLLIPLVAACAGCKPASGADGVEVRMHLIDARGVGESIGWVRLSDGEAGLRVETRLSDLPPGAHGFHFHEVPDCGPAEKDGTLQAGEAAGAHFDPQATGRHAGPEGQGHAGDLPMLKASPSGRASAILHAPQLKLANLGRRALIVHRDPDDYAGSPGGARIACGIVGP